ncbi:DUF3048 domain-containing protein [Patescibacteria group bacterium]|nr:DUF3048 domain-containing protein [Patescibacteria group bacterium]
MKKRIKNNKIILSSLIALVFLISLGIYFYYSQTIDYIEKNFNLTNEKTDCKFIRRLDGMCVNKNSTNLWPIAVMIDNHPDAWPQSGLSQAQLVYSTLAEGGATRLLAVFTTNKSMAKIGPVRSARPYYLTWAKELNALYTHSGGSPEALQKIKDWEILNLEEITSYGPLYLWRDKNKFSPHNLFTSNERLELARQDWELKDKTPNYRAWQFSKDATQGNEKITNITINYSPGILFDVEYNYNTTTNSYLRFQNNAPHIDALINEQISVKNLIVQFVPEEKHLDAEDRLHIETLGSSKAWIFLNGQIIKGKWVKENLETRTIFYNESGDEITFLPGNIWVEVAPENRKVEIKVLK